MNGFSFRTGILNEAVFRENSGPRLLFCSDWAPIRRYADSIIDAPGSLYGDDVKALLTEADYRVVNVESVLHPHPEEAEPVYKEGGNLIGPARAVEDLRAAGFDLGLLANNHIYDFGREGLQGTDGALRAAGLETVGAGTSQDDAYEGFVIEAKGTSVAIVNFQEGEEGVFTGRSPEVAGWDLDRVCASIRQHAEAGRFVVAVPHADREYLPVPSPYIQNAYRRLVEAGAGAVIGHHPHVPRGIELYAGAPICYSQGNFLFSHEHAGLFRRLGYMVELVVSRQGPPGLRLIPYYLDASGIHLLTTEQKEWFMNQLLSVSGNNLAPERVRAWWEAAIDAISIDDWYQSCTGMDYGMNLMRKGDPVGLARLRTRLSGPAHYEFMIAGINRILSGQHGTSDPQMLETVHLWTEALEDAFPVFAS